jgi:hypothetical protein
MALSPQYSELSYVDDSPPRKAAAPTERARDPLSTSPQAQTLAPSAVSSPAAPAKTPAPPLKAAKAPVKAKGKTPAKSCASSPQPKDTEDLLLLLPRKATRKHQPRKTRKPPAESTSASESESSSPPGAKRRKSKRPSTRMPCKVVKVRRRYSKASLDFGARTRCSTFPVKTRDFRSTRRLTTLNSRRSLSFSFPLHLRGISQYKALPDL